MSSSPCCVWYITGVCVHSGKGRRNFIMEFMSTTDEVLYWSKKRFGENQQSLTRAVASLGTDRPLIDIRKVGGRWVVCCFILCVRCALTITIVRCTI